MWRIVFTIPLIILSTVGNAQSNLDSLYAIWQNETLSDSTRVTAFYRYISNGFLYSQPDSAYSLGQDLVDFSVKNNYKGGEAIGMNLQGVSQDIRGNSVRALELYKKSLAISQEIGDKSKIGNVLNNIGIIYEDQGDYLKAINYYERSLKINESVGDKSGIARSLGNIGDIYKSHQDLPKALEYYQRSLTIRQEIGSSTGSSYKDIGDVYFLQKDHEEALRYYTLALTEYELLNNDRGMAYSLGKISEVHKALENYNLALTFNSNSLVLLEQVGDQPAIANLLVSNGDLYLKLQNYSKSLHYCERAFQLAQTVKHLSYQKDACKCLYESYKKTNNINSALKYLEVMSMLEDSLQSEETSIKLQQMEFHKQILADSIKQEEEKRKVKLSHEEDLLRKKRARNLSIGGGLIVLMFAIGLWVRLRWVRKSRFLLQKEKDRSEKLLLNILPVEIAEELKSRGKAEARNFEMVSILFTDFQDFTQISQQFSAKELVEELNICFQEFDKICVKNGIEKIKTIGDSYMAAGGLPVPTNDSVKNTIVAALEMQEFILKRKSENMSQRKPAFEMRAGVHTGTIVAGIVGLNKFQYDVWGDTVNTSSRMESNGRVGKVNISQDTYEFIKDDLDFTFENRGQIEVKGKGEMGMWFVMRRI